MGRVVRLGAVSREETPTAAMRSLILSVVLVGFATPAFAQAVCGGHYITYIGGLPTATPGFRTYIGGPPTATPRIRQHGPPTLSEPSGMTVQDRALWDALIFDAYEHPTPSPDAEDYWRSSIPLEERHTRVMDTGDATSFGLCIQKADESYTGQRLEQYDSAWWRGEVQRFTNGRWTGTLEVGTCTGDPPAGWVYVREGDPGEVDDDSIAHTVSWFSTNTHGTVETWVKSEIVFHSERKVRNTSEAYFKVTLAHELGHVLGLSHVPPSSGFVMAPGTLSTWPDQESRLAQLAHQVGAGFEYPGFGPANTPATGAPTITGTARVDETLTAVTTGIMDDADGLTSPTYTRRRQGHLCLAPRYYHRRRHGDRALHQHHHEGRGRPRHRCRSSRRRYRAHYDRRGPQPHRHGRYWRLRCPWIPPLGCRQHRYRRCRHRHQHDGRSRPRHQCLYVSKQRGHRRVRQEQRHYVDGRASPRHLHPVSIIK